MTEKDRKMTQSYATILVDTPDAYPAPALSAHIWEFDLPEDLEAGLHSVVVESEDEFRQRHRGVLSFEVIAER